MQCAYLKHKIAPLFFCVLTVLYTAVPSAAAQLEQTVAILDLGKVLVNSLAMKDVNVQFRAFDKKIKEDAKANEVAFRLEQDDLARQRVIISPELFEKKSKALSIQGRNYRNEYQAKLKQLAQSRSVTIRKIEAAMEPVVSAVAKSVGATMIVEKKKILFGERKLEITDLVIARLNAKLKKMQVTLVPLDPVK